jgi:hypothetical protein
MQGSAQNLKISLKTAEFIFPAGFIIHGRTLRRGSDRLPGFMKTRSTVLIAIIPASAYMPVSGRLADLRG